MGEKKINNLVVLLGILVVLILIFFGLQKWNAAQEALKTAQEEAEIIYAFQAELPEEITYSNNTGAEWTFEKAGDEWIYVSDTEVVLDQSTMENMAEAFSNIVAVKEVENPDSLSYYGLEEPQYQIQLISDGTKHTLLIGDAAGEYYYFMEEGTEIIYTISNSFANELKWDLSGVAKEDVFPYIASSDFRSITVSYADGTEYVCDSEVAEQEEAAASIASSIAVMYFSSCVDYHVTEESLAGYGLDAASRTTVTISYVDDGVSEEAVLYVGSLNEAEEYYFVQLEGSNMVNLVLKDSVEKFWN